MTDANHQAMTDLFDEIREQCSAPIWSKGVQLARRDAITGDHAAADEISLRVLERERGLSAKVSLFLDDLDWHSDCHCKADPCHHVAAAMIALKHAKDRGQALPQSKTAAGRVGYRFWTNDKALHFKRVIVSDSGEQDLQGALSNYTTGRRDDIQVSATREDMAVEVALGHERKGALPAATMRKLLPTLTSLDDIQLNDKPIQIHKAPLGLTVEITDEGPGIYIQGHLDPAIEQTFTNGAVKASDGLHPAQAFQLQPDLVTMLREGRIFGRNELADFATRILPVLQEQLPVHNRSRNLPDLSNDRTAELELELTRHGSSLKIQPAIVYGSPPLARLTAEGFRLLGDTAPPRDLDRERALKDQLWQELKLDFDRPVFEQGDAAIARVQAFQNWSGHLRGDGLDAFSLQAPLTAQVTVGGTPDHPDFAADFVSDEGDGQNPEKRQRADAQAVLKAWQQGESYVPLLAGGWAALPHDWLERYGRTIQELLSAKEDQGELSKAHVPAMLQLADDTGTAGTTDLAPLRAFCAQFDGIPAARLPAGFNAELRDYQKTGVDWLAFLKSQHLGGLLADDMGLGKTLQSIAVLEAPSLVVAPTSVIPNWQQEIRRFRPDLRLNIYHGSGRELDPQADVTLTSYGLVRQDSEKLRQHHWQVVVLDEAQWIKNPDSQVTRACWQLNGRFRLALSGTPVENHLEDLWSQFQFLNPGLFGQRQFFRDEYSKPIEDGDPVARSRLQQKLKPFLLRRVKKDVAPELPPRTETVLYAELSAEERQLYDSLYATTRQEIVRKLQAGGQVMEALEALLRMRQACCHPALIPGQQAARSAKCELLLDSLSVALEEGHKALVFSQWTSLLDLLEPLFAEQGIPYLRLDGSTRDRGRIVEQFQNPDGPPVLIMSLKAGGVGLNLSQADHVYIMDPWWNPAVEDQAADRAHRIGQQNPVLIHPLVALNTVEEKILALQQHKRTLAAAAVGEGEAGASGRLTKEDLLNLFD